MVVLLVDDDPLIAYSVAYELEAAGHRVVGPAHDVATVLALAERERPEVALVDINLGEGGDGVALARALRRAGVLPLFASGESGRARANRDAALGCLVKPYSPEDAVRSLEAAQALLDGRRAPCPPGMEWFGPPGHAHPGPA